MEESLSTASLSIVSVPGHTFVSERTGHHLDGASFIKKYLQISEYQTNLFCDQKCKCDSVSG